MSTNKTLSLPMALLLVMGLAVGLPVAGCGDDDNAIVEPDAEVQPDAQLFECGNDFLEPGEECDDGNLVNGDGCSRECTWEGECGNGIQEPPEECDGTDGLPTCVQLGDLEGITVCDASCSVIEDCQDASDDLVAWYKLDETGGMVEDDTGNGNGCNVFGTVERGMPGVIENAYLFDGGDGYANCGAGYFMDGMDGLTLEAWVSMTSYADEGMIISRASSLDASHLSFFMGIAGGPQWPPNRHHFMFSMADPDAVAFTDTSVPTGEWHHVAGVYEAGNLTIYLDGEVSGTATQLDTGPVPSPANALTFLGHLNDTAAGWGTFFAGYLDDIKVWRVARTADEVCVDAGGNPDGGACSIPDL